MWLHLAHQPCSGPGSSLVFCVVQSKTVNSHRADYNMLDTFYPVGRKHTAWHRWGSHSHLICCGLWRWGGGGRTPWENMAGASHSLCYNSVLLKHQAANVCFWCKYFFSKGAYTYVGFIKEEDDLSICIYLYAFVGKIIMVEQASNFVKASPPTSLIARTLMP